MPKLRTVSRWIVITLVVLVGCAVILHNALLPSQAASTLQAGTTLSGKPAPVFQLTDQTGKVIALAQLRGHPVVLTFLDATCPSSCPATAPGLDRTAQLLGVRSKDVAWLALSVNPANTPADAAAFMAAQQVKVPLHVLVGTASQLAPLWQAYGIAVSLPAAPGGATQHTVVTYLIDARGHERELLNQTYDPKLAAQDLRTLLAG